MKWYGRRTMQVRVRPPTTARVTAFLLRRDALFLSVSQAVGFLMMFVLYLACGAGYATLTSSTAGYHALQAR